LLKLVFCKFVFGISKKSVNIAARAEISQYPLDIYIKLQLPHAKLTLDGFLAFMLRLFSLVSSKHSIFLAFQNFGLGRN
jgi:hypothetical protein